MGSPVITIECTKECSVTEQIEFTARHLLPAFELPRNKTVAEYMNEAMGVVWLATVFMPI